MLRPMKANLYRACGPLGPRLGAVGGIENAHALRRRLREGLGVGRAGAIRQ